MNSIVITCDGMMDPFLQVNVTPLGTITDLEEQAG